MRSWLRAKLLPLRSDFAKNVSTMLGGTAIASVVPLVATPILTRLYSPSDFGLFALFYGLVGSINGASSGAYENSILVPKSELDANHLTILTCALSTVFCLLLAMLMPLIAHPLSILLKSPSIESWLYLIPFVLASVGIWTPIRYWLLRRRAFRTLAGSGVVQVSVDRSVAIFLGFNHFGSGGQIIGYAFGQGLITIGLVYLAFRILREEGYRPNWTRIWALAKQHKHFPMYTMPGGTISTFGVQMPVFILGGFFGPAIVGLYNVMNRIYGINAKLISSTLGEVLKQRASAEYAQKGECAELWRRMVKRLLVLGFLPAIPILLFGPQLFGALLGPKWIEAGRYAQILAPYYGLSVAAGPLSIVMLLSGKQKVDFVWQVAVILLCSSGLIIGARLHSPRLSLGLFGIVYSLMYVIYLRMSYLYSLGSPSSAEAQGAPPAI